MRVRWIRRPEAILLCVLAITAVASRLLHGVSSAEALDGCKRNQKNISTALEMYSTDNSGRFPLRLKHLPPAYLSKIPRCPAAGLDTYSAAFASVSNPDHYTIVCSGVYHDSAGLPANHPQYITPNCWRDL
jgi:hypothetical protein